MWPTPAARDDQRSPEAHMAGKERMASGPRHEPTSLTVVVKLWPTPTAAEGGPRMDPVRSGEPNLFGIVRTHGPSLTRRAGTWPTPQARDHKGAFSGHRDGGRDLPAEAMSFPSGHRHRMIGGPGKQSSRPVVLNPAFVEWLMGLPAGWSDCTRSATASYRSWLRRHSSALRVAPGSSR
jgi:hypothetical protein